MPDIPIIAAIAELNWWVLVLIGLVATVIAGISEGVLKFAFWGLAAVAIFSVTYGA
ncbi:MAG: hypothetical protein NUV35_06775 [Syntrophomonadaceae bacterium]|jgi:hypothetical protein|nr:hypothetical protein [Syntrophomonadaceae bacterium]